MHYTFYSKPRTFLLFLLALAFLPVSDVHAQDITTGLAGHWKFDETSGTSASDSSGNNNTGTLTNSPTWTTGKINSALSFDGVNDYADIGTMNVSGSGITIAAWVKADSFSSAIDTRFISKANSTSEQGHYWMLGQTNSGGDKLRFRLKAGGSTQTLIASSGDLPTGTWFHAIATYDGSTMRLYKDGIEVGSVAKSGTIDIDATIPANIARNPDGSNHMDGTMDDVRIYNRALSTSDIQALYAYTGGPPDTQSPTTPTNLTASAISSSQINLSWTQGTDNIGVTGYRVYRGGTQVASPSTTSYSDTGLSPSTTYSYTVAAVDGAGNVSVQSTSASATTQAPPPPDTQAPTTPTNLSVTAQSSSQINLSWTASTDNVGVTGYRVERCTGASCTTFSQISTPSSTTYNDTGLAANTTYRYRVRAVDAAGNLSGYSSIVNATTQTAPTGGAYTRVFYDGSEAGNTNLWQQDGFRNRCQSVTSSADSLAGPYAGSRMIRCNWDGVVAWNDPAGFETLVVNSVSYANEIFYRAKLRIDQNVEKTNGSPLKMLRIFYWDGNQSTYRDMLEVAQFGSSLSNRGDGIIVATTYWGGAAGDNTGSSVGWHEVEYYINHTTGSIKVWHDGVLIRNDIANLGSQKWLPFYLSSNWSDAHDAVNYVYFDDFEIYTDSTSGTAASGSLANGDITTGTTPPPTDTQAPSIPTNLSASAVSSSQINLSWTASTDNVGVTGYRVERCQGAGCSTFAQVGTPATNSYSDAGLTASTAYSYRVRAADAAGNLSGYSSIVNATTQTAPTGGGYTRVFYDGWESGNTNLWGQSDFRNKCPVVTSALDGGAVPHGTRMLRCNWNGVVAWNDPASFEALVLNSWNYSTELLVRFWVRTDTSDFNGLSGPKYFRIGTDSTGSTVSFMAMHVGGGQQGGFYNDTGQIGGTFWGGGSDAANGAWHEVELYVKVHASNGAVRLWEDGVMLWEATNTNTVLGNGWTPFFISSNWSGPEGCCDHDTNNHLYWDDFEIFSDSTSGTAATGNLSDASIAVGGTPPSTTLVGDLNQPDLEMVVARGGGGGGGSFPRTATASGVAAATVRGRGIYRLVLIQ